MDIYKKLHILVQRKYRNLCYHIIIVIMVKLRRVVLSKVFLIGLLNLLEVVVNGEIVGIVVIKILIIIVVNIKVEIFVRIKKI